MDVLNLKRINIMRIIKMREDLEGWIRVLIAFIICFWILGR